MEKRLKVYIEYAKQLTANPCQDENERKRIKEEMIIQISFFQHERLIHLIVTVVFALLTFMTLISCLLVQNMALYLLVLLLVVLLIPYIRHYYILENGVQKLYELYDRMEKDWKN